MAISEAALIAKWMRDNPEATAAHLATDRYDYLNPKHTGTFIGRKGNEGYAYWDSQKDKYVHVANKNKEWTKANKKLLRGSGGEKGIELIWYTNRHGDRVLGTRPDQSYRKDMGGGLGSERIEGIDPDWKPSIQPDHNGMGDDGGQRRPDNVDDWSGSSTHDIDGNPIPGSPGDPLSNPNLPGNNPGNNFGGGGNTSWDWSQFESNLPTVSEFAPPYTPDYTLGQESPWGNAGVEGGNEEFYRTQFNNLNRQNQAQQTAAIAAALRRQFAAENPAEPTPNDWSWANNGQGLPEVVMAGGTVDNPTAPSLQEWITPGETTNYEIANRYGANFADKKYAGNSFQHQLNAFMSPNDSSNSDWNVDTDWSKGLSAQGLVNRLPGDLAPVNVEFLSDIYNSMFDVYGVNTPEGGGATAKPGYALPVGMYPSGNSNE